MRSGWRCHTSQARDRSGSQSMYPPIASKPRTTTRHRVALVAHSPPEAPWTGERRRIRAAYEYLSTRFRCDLILCQRQDTVGHRIVRKVSQPLAPPYAARFSAPPTDWESYAFVWVFELWALSCVPRRILPRVIWDKDTVMAGAYATSPSALHRLMGRWVRGYETYGLKRVRHGFLSLKSDVEELATPKVSTLPNGLEVRAPSTQRSLAGQSRPLRLGFIGLLSHEPNRRGIIWFAREVLPGLCAHADEFGGIELQIAGAELNDRDAEILMTSSAVRLLGYVPSVASFYEDVDLAVAPLLHGAGGPTKVVEALGFGTPVVGTSVGLRGLHPDLRQGCVEVVDGDWRSAIQAARQLAKAWPGMDSQLRKHTWNAVFDRCAGPVIDKAI